VHPAARLALQAERARVLASRLMRAFAHGRAAALQRVQAARARLVRELRAPPPQARRVDALETALVRNGRERLARAARDVERLGAALALLNPAAVLDRGYAIVTEGDGRIVGNAAELRIGDEVGLTFAKGRARATIDSTQPPGDASAESATSPSAWPSAPSNR